MIWPPLQPEPDELLDELELLLELDDELLELEELELEEELDELEELEEELPEFDPLPPQAARAQDAKITGISLFMSWSRLLLLNYRYWWHRHAGTTRTL